MSPKNVIITELLRLHYIRLKKKRKSKKRFCVRRIFADRKTKGELHMLVKELNLFDHEYFFKQFRMLPDRLEELFTLVGPKILKCSMRREAICPRERLCVTLRYLATGDSRTTIATGYRISPTTVSRIINETCSEIWKSYSKMDI